VLTQQLAPRCDALLEVDIIEQPLVAARDACANQPWVRFRRMKVPDEWSDGFSISSCCLRCCISCHPKTLSRWPTECSSLDSTGLVLLVNWRGRSGDPCTGGETARLFIKRAAAALQLQVQIQEDKYRLDLLGRR
jgi:hypothetical protein